jgi:hypothetical protein
VIVRDDSGIEWECTELDDWAGGGDAGSKRYRLLRCTRVNCPEAATRYISMPLKLDLADPCVQRQVLSRPRKRE